MNMHFKVYPYEVIYTSGKLIGVYNRWGNMCWPYRRELRRDNRTGKTVETGALNRVDSSITLSALRSLVYRNRITFIEL